MHLLAVEKAEMVEHLAMMVLMEVSLVLVEVDLEMETVMVEMERMVKLNSLTIVLLTL